MSVANKITRLRLKKRYKILIIIIISLSTLILWARYISTSGLVVKEYKIVNDNLPEGFHGLKVVHFTDIHYGRTINKRELRKIVKEINLLTPDIVFFTGDLIDKDIAFTETIKEDVISSLKDITALYGKYAISGNHDFYFEDYEKILEESNFINLNNNYDVIYNKKYERIFVGGIECEINGNPNIEKVMNYFEERPEESELEAPYKILIIHVPDTFDEIKHYNFDLVLAGHSHNGQIRLPFIGKIFTPEKARNYYDPYYKIDNTDFFISGGLGTSVINLRFFNKPSFNLYRLTKK
jgi:uncharacterized protein